MRVAYNDSDDRAGLRGYVQFNKYTCIHTYIQDGISFNGDRKDEMNDATEGDTRFY